MLHMLTGLNETGTIRHDLVPLQRNVGHGVRNSDAVLINKVPGEDEPKLDQKIHVQLFE